MKKILYIILIITTFFFVGVGLIVFQHDKNIYIEDYKDHIKHELKVLGSMAQLAMLSNDYSSIEENLLNWTDQDDNLIFTEVIRENGFIIAQYSQKGEHHNYTRIIETVPLLDGGSLIYTVDFSIEFIEEKAQSLLFKILIYGLFFTILLLVSLWLIIYRIAVVPLNKLIEGTQKIGNGNLEFSIEIESKDEFGTLASSFNLMTIRLRAIIEEQKKLTEKFEAKNKELEQVLYVTSHDLRSPLVNIAGYSKELDYSLKELMAYIENGHDPTSIKEKLSPIVNKDIPESIHYIHTSVLKMETLLKGILILSRLKRLELTIEEIDMNKMITDIIDNHKYRLNELQIKTEVAKLPNCMGDKNQINQVFSNLLDNAIKYSDSERHSFIAISGYHDKDQSVYCIEDNGIGIAPEYKEKIFDIFYQLEPKRVKGEGMGLTIAHRIIEEHNGKIWVESELSKGCKFFVSLLSE